MSTTSSPIEHIESMFTKFTSAILDARPLSITLPNRDSKALDKTTRFNTLTQVIEPVPCPILLDDQQNREEEDAGSLRRTRTLHLPTAPTSASRSRTHAQVKDDGRTDKGAESGADYDNHRHTSVIQPEQHIQPRGSTTAASIRSANASAREFAVTLRTLLLLHENLTPPGSVSSHAMKLKTANEGINTAVEAELGTNPPHQASITNSQAHVTYSRITKREMFYRDPQLYRTQAVLDKSVDDIAAMMGRSRSELGVEAAGRGLVLGDVHWVSPLPLNSEDRASGSNSPAAPQRRGGAQEVRNIMDEIRIIPSEGKSIILGSGVSWVLVVEKEATFRVLAQDHNMKAVFKRGIMITGKGYPSLSVRSFLRSIADSRPNIPMLGLVDFDPHGLDILITYKFGSASQAHVNASLAVQRIEWFGLRRVDIVTADSGFVAENVFLPLSLRDRLKAMKLLGKPCLDGLEEWKAELIFMLVTGVKAEIQALADQAGKGCGGVENWVFRKLKDK